MTRTPLPELRHNPAGLAGGDGRGRRGHRLARTDRDTARQLLALLTTSCRTPDRFEEERAFLFGIGIPARFLSSARELGRTELT